MEVSHGGFQESLAIELQWHSTKLKIIVSESQHQILWVGCPTFFFSTFSYQVMKSIKWFLFFNHTVLYIWKSNFHYIPTYHIGQANYKGNLMNLQLQVNG